MMSRFLLSIVYTLFFFTGAFAQQSIDAQLEWGDEYVEPNSTRATKMISIQKDGFYMLREKVLSNPSARPRVYLEYFDRNMRLKKSVEQELKYKGKQRDFEDILMLNGELYLLTTFNNEAKKRNFLFKQRIGSRSLIPSKKLDMIADTEARNSVNEGTFDFRISKDSSHLLIFNDLPYQKRSPERFALRVFDKNFEEVWEKNIILPYADNQMSVEEYRVDENGNVYLLAITYRDGSGRRRRNTANYEYTILAYTNNGEDFEEYKVDIKNKFITDLTFRVGNDGNLICAGFYSEKDIYSTKGTYFFKLDTETKEIYNQNLKEFDFEFLTTYMRPKELEKARQAEASGNREKQAELYNFSLDDLIMRSDGGAVLVAEQYYVYEVQDFDRFGAGFGGVGVGGVGAWGNNNFRIDYYYNYNDIIVVNIKPTGEIEWSARIPKRQETVNDGGYYSSYARATLPTGLYFVYNDNSRNFENNDGKSKRLFDFGGGGNSVITVARIDKDGEVTRFPLFKNRDADTMMRPKMSKQIGRNEMAIFGEKGRYFRLASLKF